MRQTFLIVSLLFTTNSFSQLTIKDTAETLKIVSKLKKGAIVHAEIGYQVMNDGDTLYTFFYRNNKYSTLYDFESISFSGGAEVLNQFYDVLKSVFKEENRGNRNYKVGIVLGEQDVLISIVKLFGLTGVRIFTDRGFIEFTEKELDTLFDRR